MNFFASQFKTARGYNAIVNLVSRYPMVHVSILTNALRDHQPATISAKICMDHTNVNARKGTGQLQQHITVGQMVNSSFQFSSSQFSCN